MPKTPKNVRAHVGTHGRIVIFDLGQLLRHARSLYTEPLRWRTRRWSMCLIVLLVVSLSCFVDNALRTESAAWHNWLLDALFGFGHWYGGGQPTMYLLLGAYVLGLIAGVDRLRNAGALIAESYVLSGILTIVIKSLFGRWRPFAGHGSFAFTPFTTGPNEHLSLPSGHATVAFALSSVMAGMFDNRLWRASWYGAAVVTAISRVYHDQHWLSDVMLSAIIGTSVGIWLVRRPTITPMESP